VRNQRITGAERYITFCSIIVGIGALVILAGWQFNVETLKSILPQYISMKVNTAIGFLFLATALWPLRKREQSRIGDRIILIFSVLVATIGLLSLLEYLLNWDLKIDELFYLDSQIGGGTEAPGRIAPITAVNFLLISMGALLTLSRKRNHSKILQLFQSVAFLTAFQSLIGYSVGFTHVFGQAFYSQMALHTSVFFILISSAFLISSRHHGLVAVLSSSGKAGVMARRLIFFAIVVPPLVNWLQTLGQAHHLFDANMGALFLILANVIFFTTIVWRNAFALQQSDLALRTSHRNLAALIEALPQMIWTTTPDGRIDYLNDRWRNYVETGNAVGEALDWTKIAHPEDGTRAQELWIDAIRSGKPFKAEFRIRRAGDHTDRWHLATALATQDEKLQIERWYGSCTDIDEERRAEIEVRAAQAHREAAILIQASERRLRNIIDSAFDAIVGINEEGEVIEWNPRAADIFRLPREEALRRTFLEAIEPSSITDLAMLKRFPANSGPLEMEAKRSNGERFPIRLSLSAVKLGDSTSYTAFIADLSEIKRAESELAKQRAVLTSSAKMSSLGEMAGGIAHEINNPLASIRILSAEIRELVAETPIDSVLVATLAANLETTGHRIQKIISGLLAFSRDGSADPFGSVGVNELILQTLELCKARFKHAGVILRYSSIPVEIQIESRPTELSQVLLNLLNNAHDAVENLTDKWVEIEVDDLGSEIRITVTDSGHGIPSANREKIFDPFFTTKDVGRGTGLGLSVSAGIVARHSGRLEVDYEFPNTRFILILPKKQNQVYPHTKMGG
jgi:PAS domain S-box-containing protein